MSNVSPAKSSRGFQRLSDWLNLAFLADTNWRSMISRSELPGRVTSLVAQVVSESRLSRFEKAQVTKDLLAHFEDGDQRGKPFPKLIEDFGDPTTVAALIRISKLRNRSMISKLFRGGMWTGLAGLVGYIGLAAFFHMEVPQVSVDYTNELNLAANSAVEEDKAWLVYRDVWAEHKLWEGFRGPKFEEIYLKEGDARIRYVKPSDGESWDALTKKLKDSEDLLESFRVGGALPALGLALQADGNKYSPEDRAALFPYQPADEPFDNSPGVAGISEEADQLLAESMVGILIPHVQTLRSAVRILRADTRWAMEQGDTERATRNIEAVFGMSHQAAEAPFLVGGLVGIALQGIGYRIIDESMSHGKFERFDQQQLARIQMAIAKHSAADLVSFDGERLFVKDIIQRVYSDDGNGDGRMTPVGSEVMFAIRLGFMDIDCSNELDLDRLFAAPSVQRFTAPLSFLTMPTRKQTADKLDELMDEFEARCNVPICLDDMPDLETKIEDLEHDGYQLLADLIPAYQAVRRAMFRSITNQGGTEMALAAYRYHKLNGEFPTSSEELVGEFLDAIPADQFNGNPLNYKLTENGFKVYSVGYDLDDDGGQPIMVKATEGEANEPAENAVEENANPNPLATVNGMRPQAAGEFQWTADADHQETNGDWVIWPRYAEAEDDLRD